MPKEARNPKPENTAALHGDVSSDFGLQLSFGFQISESGIFQRV
jgi:hypothetical protein